MRREDSEDAGAAEVRDVLVFADSVLDGDVPVRGWKKLTPAERANIVALYRDGLKLDAIAETHKRDRQTIRRVVQRRGLSLRPRSWATYYIGPGRRSDYGPSL